MKLQIVSDVHLDMTHYNNPFNFSITPVAPYLVLAGDLYNNCLEDVAIDWIKETSCMFEEVFFIFGNHDFYVEEGGENVDDIKEQFKGVMEGTTVTVLDDELITRNGKKIFGGTMWTDFHDDPIGEYHCSQQMNDYQWIRHMNRKLTTRDTKLFHGVWCALFLAAQKEHGSPDLIITHHSPCQESLAPKYAGNQLNGAYYEPMGYLIKEPTTWVHGHTHGYFDGEVPSLHGSRVICNPRGYQVAGQEKNFRPDKVIEI